MNFSEDLILEALKQNILPLWNAFSFFVTYANIDQRTSTSQQETQYIAESSKNRLDTWILGELTAVTNTIDNDL
jgi:isoleucyl-tRNA synthetase